MSIANVTEVAILKLVYNATAWANYADNAASSPQSNIACALHTADPGDTGDQSTNETTYTGYLRINVARTTGGWTVNGSNGTCSPFAIMSWGAGTGGSGTVTHFSTGFSNAAPPTGAQSILWSGTVTPNINVGNGVTPQLTVSTTITLD